MEILLHRRLSTHAALQRAAGMGHSKQSSRQQGLTAAAKAAALLQVQRGFAVLYHTCTTASGKLSCLPRHTHAEASGFQLAAKGEDASQPDGRSSVRTVSPWISRFEVKM